MPEDMRVAVGPDDSHVGHVNAESKEKNPLSKDHARDSEMDDPENVRSQHHRDPSYDPYLSPKLEVEDQHTTSYLPPVLEEPNSSFSDGISHQFNLLDVIQSLYGVQNITQTLLLIMIFAADDDPLPAIEDLQISGEAYPGRELQACGFSTNGTTSCNFEVRSITRLISTMDDTKLEK